jgi:transcriptional regulator with XRE-family HTH domain
MSTKRARADLARFLKARRNELELSQEAVAERAGLRASTVMRLERGDIPSPRPDTLQQLAHALGVSFEDLFARIGYLDADKLPEPAPYLRTRYRGYSDTALKEAEQMLSEWEQRHSKRGTRAKRAG